MPRRSAPTVGGAPPERRDPLVCKAPQGPCVRSATGHEDKGKPSHNERPRYDPSPSAPSFRSSGGWPLPPGVGKGGTETVKRLLGWKGQHLELLNEGSGGGWSCLERSLHLGRAANRLPLSSRPQRGLHVRAAPGRERSGSPPQGQRERDFGENWSDSVSIHSRMCFVLVLCPSGSHQRQVASIASFTSLSPSHHRALDHSQSSGFSTRPRRAGLAWM